MTILYQMYSDEKTNSPIEPPNIEDTKNPYNEPEQNITNYETSIHLPSFIIGDYAPILLKIKLSLSVNPAKKYMKQNTNTDDIKVEPVNDKVHYPIENKIVLPTDHKKDKTQSYATGKHKQRDYTVKPVYYTVQPAEYTVQPADYTFQPIDYTVQSTEYTVKPVDYTLQPADYTVKPADYTVKQADYTLQPPDFTVKSVDYTAKTADYTLKPSENTVYLAESTVKPADYTVKPVDNTVEPAENTVQTTDNTVQPADYKTQSADYTVQSEDYTDQPAKNTVQSAEITVQSEENTDQPADYTAKSSDYTVKPADYTVKPAEITVHLAENAVQSEENTVQPASEYKTDKPTDYQTNNPADYQKDKSTDYKASNTSTFQERNHKTIKLMNSGVNLIGDIHIHNFKTKQNYGSPTTITPKTSFNPNNKNGEDQEQVIDDLIDTFKNDNNVDNDNIMQEDDTNFDNNDDTNKDNESIMDDKKNYNYTSMHQVDEDIDYKDWIDNFESNNIYANENKADHEKENWKYFEPDNTNDAEYVIDASDENVINIADDELIETAVNNGDDDQSIIDYDQNSYTKENTHYFDHLSNNLN